MPVLLGIAFARRMHVYKVSDRLSFVRRVTYHRAERKALSHV